MNFEEHAAKPLLAAAGMNVPQAVLARTPDEAFAAAAAIGSCVVKAQVPAGKRGKAGGIRLAATPSEARNAAAEILKLTIAGHPVGSVLVEAQVAIAHEMYAAVMNDAASQGPLLLFSAQGGMDIEDIAAERPDALVSVEIDIRHGLRAGMLATALPGELPCDRAPLIDVLTKLYAVYAAHDAELVEINPLVVTQGGDLVALDCKFVMDDSAVGRHAELSRHGSPEKRTALEQRAHALDLKFIELDGDIGILANGAGLTMTTMDAVSHFGGAPANFLEIGGESYTRAKPALELVLANPRVKVLLVNFCGAFARTDVMAEGVIGAWQELRPSIPIFFTIHGTGEDEAIQMVRERLGIEPFDAMDNAVKAAVAAARVTA